MGSSGSERYVRTPHGVVLDGDRSRGSFSQSQRGGFVTKTHIAQREIPHQLIILWLFFEERFQFAARLSPSFLGRIFAGDGSCQSSKRTRRSVANATYSDATGAILERLFGSFAPDFPHYISGKEFKK